MESPGSYLYRCYSDSSAGGLISGKDKDGRSLSNAALHSEFINHVQLRAQNPTALVSASNRLIDTLRRAFSKLYEDKEISSKIWIAFIYVPDVDKHVFHHAEGLAKILELPNSERFRYEYIFEWDIPKKYLIHKVSVETLVERGFDMKEYLIGNALPPTSILRGEFSKRVLEPSKGGYHIGLDLGFLARCFGARAPVRQIAFQLHQDCSAVRFINHNAQILSISYWGNQVTHLDFAHFCDLEDGIDTALYDWWLADSEFFYAYKDAKREWDLWYEAALEDGDNDVDTRVENAAIRLGL